MKTSLLSSDKGSTVATPSSNKNFVPNPRPPINFFATSMLSSSGLTSPVVRLTLKILPL